MKRRSFALALYHSLSLSCILPVWPQGVRLKHPTTSSPANFLGTFCNYFIFIYCISYSSAIPTCVSMWESEFEELFELLYFKRNDNKDLCKIEKGCKNFSFMPQNREISTYLPTPNHCGFWSLNTKQCLLDLCQRFHMFTSYGQLNQRVISFFFILF